MDIRETLLSEHVLKEHFQAYNQDANRYTEAILEVLINFPKSVTITNKARALVVLIQNKDRANFTRLHPHLDLPEVLKACEILDANRHVRQIEVSIRNKLARQVELKTAYPTTRHLAAFQREIDDLVVLVEEHFDLTLTSSKIRMVQEWTRSIDPAKLEYRAILFPTDQWRKLADLCHLNPVKDFQLAWFLRYCYGQEAPVGSLVNLVDQMNYNNFVDLYLQSESNNRLIPYKIVRLKMDLKKTSLNYLNHTKIDYIKELISQYESLDTVLWYWDELNTPIVNSILVNRLGRLSSNDVRELNLSYGKLVELLVKVNHPQLSEQLIALTEQRLQSYESTIEAPVAILGDASSSMDVAIKTSSIVTSLLCSLTQAELHLFNSRDVPIPRDQTPRTIEQAVRFAKQMRASGSTSPAASLNYYYTRKQPIRTFIMITDEEENTSTTGQSSWYRSSNIGGYMFTELYQKYVNEIYPARLIFISFSDPNKDAQMVRELKAKLGEAFVSEYVDVYKFDVRNPDLNRFDFVLHRMSN